MSRLPKVSLHIYHAYYRPSVSSKCRLSQQRGGSTTQTRCLRCSTTRWLSYDKNLIAQYFQNLPRTCSKSINQEGNYSSQNQRFDQNMQKMRLGVTTEANEEDNVNATDLGQESEAVIQSNTIKLSDSTHEVQIDFKILFQPDKQETVVHDTAKLIEAISSIFNVELSLEDKIVSSKSDMPKSDETYSKSLIGNISENVSEESSADNSKSKSFNPGNQEETVSSEYDKVTQPDFKAKLCLEDSALSSVKSNRDQTNIKNSKDYNSEYEMDESSTEHTEYIPVIRGEQKSDNFSKSDNEKQSNFNTKLCSEDSTVSSDISNSDETNINYNYISETEEISTEHKPVLRGDQKLKPFSESDNEKQSNFNEFKICSEDSNFSSDISKSDATNINYDYISDYETEEISTEYKPVLRGDQKSNVYSESNKVKPFFNAKLCSENPTVSSDISNSVQINNSYLKNNISEYEMEESSLGNTVYIPVFGGKQKSNVASQSDKAIQSNFSAKLSEHTTVSSDISNSGQSNNSSITNSSEYEAEESSTENMPVIPSEQKSKSFTECDMLTKSNVVKEPSDLTKCIVSFSNKNEVILNFDVASPFSDTQKLILIHHAVLKALSILEEHKTSAVGKVVCE